MNLDSLIFIGASDFGNTTLKELIKKGYIVNGVITENNDPCKKTAQRKNIPYLAIREGLRTFRERKKEKLIDFIETNKPDAMVMCIWEVMLPKEIVNNYMILNFHGSPLPEYRGWAPINWQIIHGKKEIGMTVSRVVEDYDRGDILMQEYMRINQNTNAGQAFDQMEPYAARMMTRVLEKLKLGQTIKVIKQPKKTVYPLAPQFTDAHTKINWNSSPEQVHNLVRGCNPMAYAHTFLGSTRILIEESSVASRRDNDYTPGQVLDITKDSFSVACKSGKLRVLSVMNESERRYNMQRFVNKLESLGNVVLG